MAYSRDAFTRDQRETRDTRETRNRDQRELERAGDMELFRQLDYKLTNLWTEIFLKSLLRLKN